MNRLRGAALVLGAVALLTAGRSSAEGRHFSIDPARSVLTVRTGKAGLLAFAGHEHLIRALGVRGEIVADAAALEASSVSLTIDAGSLTVQPEGEPADDVAKVQARMRSSELLDVVRFPDILFQSVAVSGKSEGGATFDIRVSGDLSVHGVRSRIVLPVRVELGLGSLTATGRTVLRQTTFGLTPVSVGGVVKVRDEVILDYKFVGTSNP
jgi:polyisoprenoid-binding protein YceI